MVDCPWTVELQPSTHSVYVSRAGCSHVARSLVAIGSVPPSHYLEEVAACAGPRSCLTPLLVQILESMRPAGSFPPDLGPVIIRVTIAPRVVRDVTGGPLIYLVTRNAQKIRISQALTKFSI